MNLNVQAQAIAGADGWVAEFRDGPRPVLCWALVGDQLVGVVTTDPTGMLTQSTPVGSAEGLSGFMGYKWIGSGTGRR